MHPPRYLGLLLGLALPSGLLAAEPYRPRSADTVLLQRAPGAAKAVREARPAQTTSDPVARAAAAQAAIELARRSGDPRYFGQAQALLAADWTAAEPALATRLVRATLRQQRHDFEGAKTDLAAVLAADPRNAQAHLMRASIALAQGQPQSARADCAALIGNAGLLVAATCLGSANALRGQAASGLQAIEVALARDTQAAATLRLWALTQAAEIAERLGDVPRAAEHFAQALALAESSGENDVYLQAAYADFLLQQERAAEVVPLLSGKTDFDPLLLRLALAQAQLAAKGDAKAQGAAALHLKDLLARFALAQSRGDVAHLREQAMTALHLQAAPARALALAEANWAEQREPADALLLLQTAIAAGNAAAAKPVLDWLQQTGIEDVRLRPLAAQLALKS